MTISAALPLEPPPRLRLSFSIIACRLFRFLWKVWEGLANVETCSCVWHNLTNELFLQIQSIQKGERSIRIIFECTGGGVYAIQERHILAGLGLSPIYTHQTDQARHFFQSIMHPDSCIHALFPQQSAYVYTRWFRKKYPGTQNRNISEARENFCTKFRPFV